MVYTLPPMMMMDDLRSSSPSSSISSTSNNAATEVDSTNGTYFEDLKENITQDYQLIDAMDLNSQGGQNNWNWTTIVSQDDQQWTKTHSSNFPMSKLTFYYLTLWFK